jgi:hypothetical protein
MRCAIRCAIITFLLPGVRSLTVLIRTSLASGRLSRGRPHFLIHILPVQAWCMLQWCCSLIKFTNTASKAVVWSVCFRQHWCVSVCSCIVYMPDDESIKIRDYSCIVPASVPLPDVLMPQSELRYSPFSILLLSASAVPSLGVHR